MKLPLRIGGFIRASRLRQMAKEPLVLASHSQPQPKSKPKPSPAMYVTCDIITGHRKPFYTEEDARDYVTDCRTAGIEHPFAIVRSQLLDIL